MLQLSGENIEVLPEQVEKYPSTRYMGSKSNLLNDIWEVSSNFDFNSVTDLFSGSGIVSYMYKAFGKEVISNDYMVFTSTFSKALIENNHELLSESDVNFLFEEESLKKNNFVSKKFDGLYFDDEDNKFIDKIRFNILGLDNEYKQALAMSSLVRACMKKRPRGIFTYTGNRYDDGRKDLRFSLEEHFLQATEVFNNAVFNNFQNNISLNKDSLDYNGESDLVYMDPPYYSPLSDNEYVRRYHFVEGLARYWKGVEIQENTKTKKFKNYPTPFSTKEGTYTALSKLFEKHQQSHIILSYSSNSLPTLEELLLLLRRYKKNVDYKIVNHKYSFGNVRKGNDNNHVKEYLIIGW